MAWDLPSPLHAGEHWTAHRWVSNGGMGANCCGAETLWPGLQEHLSSAMTLATAHDWPGPPHWVAAAWSAATTLAHIGVYPEHINSVLMWSPLQANQLGWILPTIIAAAIGACIDVAVIKRSAA